MSEIKWGFIQNGSEFEFLVTTLIRHKHPKIRIYERLGPDAGIDAKSEDGQTVYQVKYITNQSNFSQLLGTVKKEIEKIKKYTKSKHKNYPLWKEVKNWVLVTNASCNPQDEQKWKEEVEQPLQESGISASLKHRADIEQDLIKFPSPPKGVKREMFCEYLKAIAILQPINMEDKDQEYKYFNTLLDNVKKPEWERVLQYLQNKQFVSKRGRLLEIKPDVIRDYIVFNYIGDSTSELKEWIEKLFQLKDPYKIKSALVQMAKVAYYKRYKKGDQGDNFFNEIWHKFVTEVQKGDVETQHNILELASAVSFAHPVRFLEVVKAIKDNKKEKKFFENTSMYIDHNSLIIKLPEAVYDAGKYVLNNEDAQKIFDELITLFYKESSITDREVFSLQDNEKKSETCIKKLMIINNEESRYKKIILKWVQETLNSIHQIKDKDEDTLNLLKSIVEDFFKIQREKVEVDGLKFIITFYVIHPEWEDQEYINQIMTVIWKQLNKSNTDSKKRVLLWKLISFYQNQICQAEKMSLKPDEEKHRSFWEQEIKNTFQSLKKYILTHTLHISEIKSLRSVWEWHLEYDKRQNIKILSKECENLILKNKTYEYIKPFFEGKNYYPEKSLIKKYANECNSTEKLQTFVNNCFHYAEQNKCQDVLHQIAGALVHNAKPPPDYVLNYMEKILKEAKEDYHFQFVCRILFHQAGSLRKQPKKDNLNSVLNKYWEQLKSETQKELFLKIVFSFAHPDSQGLMTKQDIEFMSEILNSDNKLSKESLYLISSFAGRVISLDFDQSKNLILDVFKKIDIKYTTALFEHYVKGVEHNIVFEEQDPVSKNKNIFLWLMKLLSINVFSKEFMDDMGNFEDNIIRIKQKLNARFFVKDYVCFLKKRLSLYKEKKIEKKFLWNNPLLKINFLKMVEPVNQKDPATQDALNTLLDFNGSESLLYRLPKIVKIFDPEGVYIPQMIIKRIKEKVFLCKQKDVPAEYEWTRYAGRYVSNSEAWRTIALVACQIASHKPQKEKEAIFSSLMNYDTEFYKNRPGEVPQLFYSNVSNAERDFKNEKDTNVKEFMKWRLDVFTNRLKSEENRVAEQDEDFS